MQDNSGTVRLVTGIDQEMNAMRENDTFVLSKPVEGTVIGEHRTLVLSVGTVVTVVLVFGDPTAPTAYEVEAFLPEGDVYALATVEAHDVGYTTRRLQALRKRVVIGAFVVGTNRPERIQLEATIFLAELRH